MSLKVVLFDFNGIIVDDEPIHQRLLQSVLLSENIRCSSEEFQRLCLGRSDRACLKDLFHLHGRVISDATMEKLLTQKANLYQQELSQLETLPIFLGVASLIQAFQAHNIALGVVSGARRGEIETVLERAMLRNAFEIIVAAEDITQSKPSPEGYQRAIASFSSRYPHWNLQPHHCLAIEDSFPGLEAARSAQIPVVGVAHTYPFHMMQRRANWAVDSLEDLEVERLLEVFSSDAKNGSEDPNNKRLEVSALASRHE